MHVNEYKNILWYIIYIIKNTNYEAWVHATMSSLTVNFVQPNISPQLWKHTAMIC